MNPPYVILALVILAACLSGISSDIYAPSLLVISKEFSANLDTVQTSMALFMIGLSASQLVYGPLSEGYGRKPIIILGLSILIVGSVVCYVSPTIEVLLLGRVIQGIGAGAASSIWRSIFKDSFDDNQAAKYIPILTIIVTFVIPAAPTLGAFLENQFGWRSTFLFLILYGLTAITFVGTKFNETNKNATPKNLTKTKIIRSYNELLTSPTFMGYALCVFISYGAFFSWIISGPVIIIKNLGHTQYTFGLMTLLGGVAMALSGLTNKYIAPKKGFQASLLFGWAIMFIAGIAMLIGALLWPTSLYAVGIPIFLFYYGVTFVWPAAFTGAFKPFGHIAGYAGSLYSFLQMGGAGLLGLLISYLPDNNQIPLSCVMIIAPILTFAIYIKVIKPTMKEPQNS